MTDLILRTARQVRVPDSNAIHALDRTTSNSAGRLYSTRCGENLSNTLHGAYLTTRAETCRLCAVVAALSNGEAS
jgi:hypothetical protein